MPGSVERLGGGGPEQVNAHGHEERRRGRGGKQVDPNTSATAAVRLTQKGTLLHANASSHCHPQARTRTSNHLKTSPFAHPTIQSPSGHRTSPIARRPSPIVHRPSHITHRKSSHITHRTSHFMSRTTDAGAEVNGAGLHQPYSKVVPGGSPLHPDRKGSHASSSHPRMPCQGQAPLGSRDRAEALHWWHW
jgi:hypothetical protein